MNYLSFNKMTFKTKQAGEHLRIKAESEGYSLIIIDSEPMNWISITFDLPLSNNMEVMVTGRDIKDYNSSIREISLDPSKVYVEIGAGIGEFIPLVVQQNPIQRPVVIDPVNYALMLEMLQCAEEFSVREDTRQRLQTYQERCKTILNQEKVCLINCRLEDALTKHPELKRTADVVIDHYAAAYHSNDEDAVLSLEIKLLKPSGKIYSSMRK